MWYILSGFILYFVAIGLVFGLVWCTRKLGRRYRRKRDAAEYARNIKAYMEDIGHNKQALGRLIRPVVKKGKYN